MRKQRLFAITFLLLLSSMAWAQTGRDDQEDGSSSENSEPTLSPSMKGFLITAVEHGVAEVHLAEMATRRAISGSVRSFAEVLMAECKRSNRELVAFAEERGVQISAENEADNSEFAQVADELDHLSGGDFDMAYLEQMVHDCSIELRQFEHIAMYASDADVRRFAARQVPALQDRLRMARQALRISEGQHSAQVTPFRSHPALVKIS
ncbi:MAG TPA: DUF4142 domain-containing protein [Terriglobales bacterium]|nr:DUF4142 domain-containing protein [Terriglobales bacterium]